jgi:hypothetical protein
MTRGFAMAMGRAETSARSRRLAAMDKGRRLAAIDERRRLAAMDKGREVVARPERLIRRWWEPASTPRLTLEPIIAVC